MTGDDRYTPSGQVLATAFIGVAAILFELGLGTAVVVPERAGP